MDQRTTPSLTNSYFEERGDPGVPMPKQRCADCGSARSHKRQDIYRKKLVCTAQRHCRTRQKQKAAGKPADRRKPEHFCARCGAYKSEKKYDAIAKVFVCASWSHCLMRQRKKKAKFMRPKKFMIDFAD